MGINVSTSFLEMAAGFLHCRIGTLPFKYRRLPVGASFKRLSTWQPMISTLRWRLKGWGNRYVSFGGWIFLTNVVLVF